MSLKLIDDLRGTYLESLRVSYHLSLFLDTVLDPFAFRQHIWRSDNIVSILFLPSC